MVRDYRGATVSVIGALERVPFARIRRELDRRGAVLSRRIEAGTGITVIAHGAVGRLARGRLEHVIVQAASEVLTEHQFLTEIGIRQRPAGKARDYDRTAFAAASRLSRKERFWLELFDVLEPCDGHYDFRDLILARQIRTIFDAGFKIPSVIGAAIAFRRAAARESWAQLGAPAQLANGELVVRIGSWLTEIDGKVERRVEYEDMPLAGHLYDLAESAEQAGDWQIAERIYRRCAQIDPNDALAQFNRANAVRHQGRVQEAAALYRVATSIDPSLAEAWYELGCMAQDSRDEDGARGFLERALTCDPHHADAAFKLAFAHLDRGQHRRALSLFEHYLLLDSRSAQARTVAQAAALCRRHLTAPIGPEDHPRIAVSEARN
jgi:tetratricopeptide (TPR) repeat protein